MRISVLDQSPIAEGSDGAAALANSIDLARLCDALGYHRYWVAEHHGGAMLAGASPEVLVAAIAQATQRIRVGSGGVMLPHYSPFKVGETFSILAALFPDRIDLAVGRAFGTDPRTAYALQRDRRQPSPDDFAEHLDELLGYVAGALPASHPFANLATAMPGTPNRPDPWLLGSSPQSAIWAGERGLPYAFADFINSDGLEIAARYRGEFRPGVRDAQYTAVAVWAIAADSDAEAQALASSSRMAMALLRRGRLIAVPPVATALRFLEREGNPAPGRRLVLGTPERVRAELEEVAHAYGADELIVVSITHDHGARRRSHALIADAFGLEPAGASAAEVRVDPSPATAG